MLEVNTLVQRRYRVMSQIGRGGMGTVYHARDENLGVTVAVKQNFFDNKRLIEAFKREARLLAGLRHPALPQVKDYFINEEGQFLVMEYIGGDDLGTILEKRRQKIKPVNEPKPFEVGEVLHWAEQLLDALDYLHTLPEPVIHRDIKPQNLKLAGRNQIILLDFGLAKGKPLWMSRIPTSSIYGYTLNYAPLEQIRSHGTDPRSDLYALGATLYHLITGTPPADAATRADAFIGGESDPLQAANEVNPKVPREVAVVLMKAMAQHRNNRPASAAEMLEMLREAKHSPVVDRQTREAPHQPRKDEIVAYRKDAWPTTELAISERDEEEQKEREEAAKRQREEEARKAQEEAEANLRAEQERLAREESERQRQQQEERLAREQEEREREAREREAREQAAALRAQLEQKERERRAKQAAALRQKQEQKAREAAEALKQHEERKNQAVAEPETLSPQEKPLKNLGEKQAHGIAGWLRKTRLLGIGAALIVLIILAVAIANKNAQPPPDQTGAGVTASSANPPQTPASPQASTETSPLEALANSFAQIPPGEFKMGSENGDNDEKPVHRVSISQGFEMGKYEVTQAQWEALMGKNPSASKGANLPVNVTWYEAQKFIRKLNARSDGYVYRLPTEAEWEYACRAGSTGDYAGNLDEMAWYDKKTEEGPYAVGQKAPNAWGLYDMHGNVLEWVHDTYGENYYGQSPPADPQGPVSGTEKVFRGGCWNYKAQYCRSAYRNKLSPNRRSPKTSYILGFRLVRTPG